MLLGKIKSFLLFNGLEAMSFKVIQKDINEQKPQNRVNHFLGHNPTII